MVEIVRGALNIIHWYTGAGGIQLLDHGDVRGIVPATRRSDSRENIRHDRRRRADGFDGGDHLGVMDIQ
jgi:hypothetical protein